MEAEKPETLEKPAETDAFALKTERTVLPPRDVDVPVAEPPPVKAPNPRMRLIPERHRSDFAHSSTWWQNNIEVFKHNETGRYLYLSREGEGEAEKIHGYMYQAAGHKFVEVNVETALAMAAFSEKKGEKRTG
jgi:GTP cyclohydrolase II